jgi:hypothetical protein
MSPLERVGLIESWYDRNIGAGDDWRKEIDDHLREADFILLLISSDFVASDYCYEVEMKFALKLHEENKAVVIPILLRTVAFESLPFANLQALPANGSFVVGKEEGQGSRDYAFRLIADGLRSAIDARRRLQVQGYKKLTGADWVMQKRFLDASMAPEIPEGETREVTALVSIDGSDGLRFVLEQDRRREEPMRSYSAGPRDVRSSSFEIEFPLTGGGFLRSPSIYLRVTAPGFSVPEPTKRITVPTLSDSKPYSFVLQTQNQGLHTVNVELICDDVAVVEQLLKTRVVQHGGPEKTPPAGGMVLAAVSLEVACVAKTVGASC